MQPVAEVEVEPKITFRRFRLTDTMVRAKLTSGDAILLHQTDRRSWKKRGSHYKARHDEKGWHIRVGKRATVKQYLTACDVVYFDGEATLFQFRTAPEDDLFFK